MYQLYNEKGIPAKDFNNLIKKWLSNNIVVKEHKTPPAFEGTRVLYDQLISKIISENKVPRSVAHRIALSDLTERLLFKTDLPKELEKRLSGALVHEGGIRSTIAQGILKNTGENFVNIIVYAIADFLSVQDEVLVDKGLPQQIKKSLEIERIFFGKDEKRKIKINIESDFCIFSRDNPGRAIIASAKTRLKEVFHVGTMWKILFDMIGDEYCEKKWSLNTGGSTKNMHYIFVTSDSIREGGTNSQGPDLKLEGVRNLLAADASFFDYVFVSKNKLNYVSGSLDLSGKRERLFHELGCILDLILQKFNLH